MIHEDEDFGGQRDYKAELHHCKAELESHQTNLKQRREALGFVRTEVKKIKAERDSLIDDIAVLRANNERLEEENKNLKDKEFKLIMENNDLITISSAIEQADDYLRGEIERLERENEKYIKLLKEFNNLINYKLDIHPGSDVYMYYRSELNKLGVK